MQLRAWYYRKWINDTSRIADHILELQEVTGVVEEKDLSDEEFDDLKEVLNSNPNIESRGPKVNQ